MTETRPPGRTDCWNRIGIRGDRSCPELLEYIHCRNCPVHEDAAEAFFDRPAPVDYIEEWSRLLSAPVEHAAPEDLSVLIFRLGDEWLALPAAVIVEVTSPRPSHGVPHRTNGKFIGLVNLRGQLQLLVSLKAILGVSVKEEAARRSGHERLVVIRKDHQTWVFESEEVLELQRFSRSTLKTVPSTLANPESSFSHAVIDYKQKSIGLLDEQRLFASLRGVCQ